MRHPYKPSASRSKAKKQLRKASLDPVRLDELLGQPSVNQVQDEVRKAQRAEQHEQLRLAEAARQRMERERQDTAAQVRQGAEQ
jgi:hypothetical protein